MMTKEEIQKGESDCVEFKLTSPSEDHKWLKTVVAFCNGDGGTIVFGVKNSSCAIVGISKKEQFSLVDGICDAVSQSITPQIVPSITYQNIDDKLLLLVTIRHGQNTPYYIKKKARWTVESSGIRIVFYRENHHTEQVTEQATEQEK